MSCTCCSDTKGRMASAHINIKGHRGKGTAEKIAAPITRKVRHSVIETKDNATITITFGEVSETHAGMGMDGNRAEPGQGLSLGMLEGLKTYFEQLGRKTELVDLSQLLSDTEQQYAGLDTIALAKGQSITVDRPHILIVRDAVSALMNVEPAAQVADTLFDELVNLDWDTKAWMPRNSKIIVNKHKRYNLNFGDEYHESDVVQGTKDVDPLVHIHQLKLQGKKPMGTIMEWSSVPQLDALQSGLMTVLRGLNKKFPELKGEGNYYFDKNKCYISFHGDTERRIVIAARFGFPMPIRYQWYYRNKANGDATSNVVGKPFMSIIGHGDMYFMSEKAVGTDWKYSPPKGKGYLSLRHAAGCDHVLRKEKLI